MYTPVSYCPICGAPIYVQNPWHGTTPPPTLYSCECRLAGFTITTTDGTLDKKVKGVK
jgi:hypothetical protein